MDLWPQPEPVDQEAAMRRLRDALPPLSSDELRRIRELLEELRNKS